MPLFEFKCEKCGSEFEELLFSRDESADVRCPRCSGDRVEKLVSGFASPGQGDRAVASGKTCAPKSPFS